MSLKHLLNHKNMYFTYMLKDDNCFYLTVQRKHSPQQSPQIVADSKYLFLW